MWKITSCTGKFGKSAYIEIVNYSSVTHPQRPLHYTVKCVTEVGFSI